nr:right-handed parallel beta-helix repeat-containing protein [uncultured Pseudomonas sp.]
MFPISMPRTLAGAFLLFGTAAVQAATLLVTTPTDSYDGQCNLHCSLRDAVQVANQTAGPSTILLPPGSYGLTRSALLDPQGDPIEDQDNQIGDLDVLGELRIRGLSASSSRIKGLYALHDRLFEVPVGAKLTLENLTLEDSYSAYNGGAVTNRGQLQLRKVLAQRNQASSGGAIANYGQLRIEDSRFQENYAFGDFLAGRGGALFNSGSASVRGSNFYENLVGDFSEEGEGAGIYNSGYVTVESSTFHRNYNDGLSRGGTITNDGGTLLLSNSTLSRNWSALTNGHKSSATSSKATLSNVTITLNRDFANGRDAVENWGELLIRNSIIAGNQDDNGELTNCTNLGDDYSYQAIGLLRNDEQSNCGADLFVPIEQTFTQVLSPTLSKPSETLWFHTLLPGSPAIDAGIGDCSAYDQRGVPRPQDGNGDGVAVCDLGAVELTAR